MEREQDSLNPSQAQIALTNPYLKWYINKMQPKSKVIILVITIFAILGAIFLRADEYKLPTPLDLSPLMKQSKDETEVVFVQSPHQPNQTYVVIKEENVTTIYNITKQPWKLQIPLFISLNRTRSSMGRKLLSRMLFGKSPQA